MIVSRSGVTTDALQDSALGRKALNLISLGLAQSEIGFLTPDFSIVRSQCVGDYIAANPATPIDKFGFHFPHKLEPTIIQHFQQFCDGNSSLLLNARSHVSSSSPPIIRTSLSLAHDLDRSFAGVNWTVVTDDDSEHALRSSISRALSGVYRPYSEWYLRREGLAKLPRPTSIILCEFISISASATVHVDGSAVRVVFSSKAGPGLSNFSYDWPAISHLGEHEKSIARSLHELCTYLCIQELEIEIIFSKSGECYITQYREIFPRTSYVSTNPLVVHNLLELPSEPESVSEIVSGAFRGNGIPLFVVNHSSGNIADVFAICVCIQEQAISSGYGIVLAFDGARQMSHIVTALEEDPQIVCVVHLPYEHAANLPTGTVYTLDDASDGREHLQ